MAKNNVEIEPVKTKAGYRRALKQVSHLFDHPPEAGSALEAEFEVLMTLVGRYETEHFDVKSPELIDAIEFGIEQRGLSSNA